MTGGVPGEKTVENGAAESHFGSGFWGGVQRIVVAVETVEKGCAGGRLERDDDVGFFALWWWDCELVSTMPLFRMQS